MPWDVLGHEWAGRLLAGHIRRGEARHAYLLCGPPGVGRRTLALRFAQALNCPQPLEAGQPCRVCKTCRQIEAMQHVDLSVVQAEKEGGTLKVDQVRELQQALSLMPYHAHYRVALLLRFQEAHPSAQNALLKTLEEAPARVVLLLTADTPESVLPTILSRCEVLRLRPLSLSDLEQELLRRGLSADRAALLARFTGGRLGAALSLNNDPDALARREATLAEMQELLASPLRERFVFAEKMTKGVPAVARDNLRYALTIWLSLWRDVLLYASDSGLPAANADRENTVRDLAHTLGAAEARRCAQAAERALSGLDANLNTRLLAEITLMDWPRFGKA
jgi:DNA polymerase-3 subunit delta'